MWSDRDELEFAISRYADGGLTPVERAALEERLATDAEARAMLHEHRRVSDLLRLASPPEVDAEALRARIGAALDAARPPSLPMPWVAWGRRLAVAAAIVLVASVGLRTLLRPAPTPEGVLSVFGPSAEPAAGAPVVRVAVAAPRADGLDVWPASETLVRRPTRVVIGTVAAGSPAPGGPF